ATSGKLKQQMVVAKAVGAIDFAPDGKLLAVGAGTELSVWPVWGTQPKWSAAAHAKPIRALAFSPDGKSIAVAAEDGKLGLWPATKGKGRPLPGHEGAITALAFSPDGKLLASACADRTIRL